MSTLRGAITLFAGGGGKTIGAIRAGYTPVLSVEHDAAIAGVYADNLGDKHLMVCPVQAVPDAAYRALEGVDLLMASPPCPSFSVANANAGETDNDREIAAHTSRAIRLCRPRRVLIENVPGYAKSDSCAFLLAQLKALGYGVSVSVVNSADFGVPQTRVRLLIRATLGKVPPCLTPTHARVPNMFEARWVGWYEAIEDLLPSCEETRLADWQLKRLPAELRETLLVGYNGEAGELARESGRDAPTLTADGSGKLRAILLAQGGYDGGIVTRHASDPGNAITANSNQGQIRAVLVGNHQGGEWGGDAPRPPHLTNGNRPAPTLTADGAGRLKALLVNDSTTLELRGGQDPSPTLGGHRRLFTRCAVLVNGTPDNHCESLPIRSGDQPATTVHAQAGTRHAIRAVLVDGDNSGKNGTIHRPSGRPAPTVSSATRPNAIIPDSPAVRVVRISPACLARFQTFPDSYRLPERRSLAATVIGNAVPCLLAQQAILSMEGGK